MNKQIPKMNLEDALKTAKKAAQDNYEKWIRQMNLEPIKRKWYTCSDSDEDTLFGLEGTPDKAFVYYSKTKKMVLALTPLKEIVLEIHVQ